MSDFERRMPECRAVLTPELAFVRFAHHLQARAPQVPIEIDFRNQIDDLVRELSRSRPLSGDYFSWKYMFGNVVFDVVDPDTPTCGLPLLRFLAYLFDGIREHGQCRIPPASALIMASMYEPGPRLLGQVQINGRAYIETTRLGVVRLGGVVRVPRPPIWKSEDPQAMIDVCLRNL